LELTDFDWSESRRSQTGCALGCGVVFPRSFLARSQDDSLAWREGFIRTFLEREYSRNLGISNFCRGDATLLGPSGGITTGRPGMPQKYRAQWVSQTRRFGRTLIILTGTT